MWAFKPYHVTRRTFLQELANGGVLSRSHIILTVLKSEEKLLLGELFLLNVQLYVHYSLITVKDENLVLVGPVLLI